LVGAENENERTYRILSSHSIVTTGRMRLLREDLNGIISGQPEDGNLAHLDADFCSTWRSVDTGAIARLFGGAFDRRGGSMAVTVTANCPDVTQGETWSTGYSVAGHIRDQGLHCLFVPLAYPTGYKENYSAHGGQIMIRFGYAWFPAEKSPAIVLGNSGLDFGLPQMQGQANLHEQAPWNAASLRRFFRSRSISL
jgi:hypothetical protein